MKKGVSALSIDDEIDIIPFGEDENQTPTESIDPELDIVPFESQRASQQQQPSSARMQSIEGSPAPEQEPSFMQQVASSAPVQAGLGLTKVITFPLDLLKFAMTAEGLSGVDEIEEAYAKEGKPFDREKFLQEVQQAASYIPTQQMGEEFIKEKTGVSLEPQGRAGKFVRGAGELFALTPGNLVRRGIGAVAGSGTAEALKEAGVPEILADLVGAGTAGIAATGKLSPKALTGEAKEAREIAEKHGLRKFAGMEKEKPPFISPVVSEAKEAALRSELSETTQKAINDVIEQKLPIRTMREQGTNLENAYTAAYDAANATAAKAGKTPVNVSPLVDFIDGRISQIKASAPSLSSKDKVVLKELKKQRDQLTNLQKAPPPIYGPQGQLLTPTTAKRIPKEATQTQLLDQYKNFNEEVSGIYRKAEFTGAENEVRKLYAELNDELINVVEAANPTLAKELKTANKIFSETARLEQVEGILSNAFKDGYNPQKLMKLLEGKKSKAYLERSLGKDSVKDLVDIAAYGQKAEKKMFDYLKNPKTVGEYINKLTPLQLSLLLGKKTALIPFAIAKPALSRIQGYVFTRNASKKSYINFLKSAATGSPAMILKAGRSFEQAIKDEFGGEQELLDLIEMEE